MNVLEFNQKYKFTEPKHTIEKKNNYIKVYVTYVNEGKRNYLKFSEELNTSYFAVTNDLTKAEKRKREEERLLKVNEIKERLKTWIEFREFEPISKAFKIPNDAKELVTFYDDYLELKKIEKKSTGTIKGYDSKINKFTEYLKQKNKDDIKVNDSTLFSLYEDYFLFEKGKGNRVSTVNDIIIFHSFVWNHIINKKRINVKHPFKGAVKTEKKQYVEKHQAIKGGENIQESFNQLNKYGSEILSLFAQAIFYTLHRGDTLAQLQLHDFDFENNIIDIPPNKIKTKRRTIVKLIPEFKEIITKYIIDNKVNEDDYLFGFEMVESVRGTKKEYRLFGSNKSDRQDYTLKFGHFMDTQLPKAHLHNPQLKKIFTKGKNSLYGYKHSSCVFLKQNGWNLEQIIQMTGHLDEEIVKIYLRDFTPTLPSFPTLSSQE